MLEFELKEDVGDFYRIQGLKETFENLGALGVDELFDQLRKLWIMSFGHQTLF